MSTAISLRHPRSWMVLAIVAITALVLASTASAAAFTVNDTTDAPLASSTGITCVSADAGQCTLRAAVQAADNLGGASTITLPGGTYAMSIPPVSGAGHDDNPAIGDLDVDALNGAATPPQITVNGAGPEATILSAASLDREFTVHSDAGLTISGVTIEHGNQSTTGADSGSTDPGDGGAIDVAGSLTVTSSVLTANASDHEGGAIYVDGNGTVTIGDSSFVNNVTFTAGGAMAFTSSTSTAMIVDDTFDGNAAAAGNGAGGALAFIVPIAAGSQVDNVTIAHDSAPNGGGIFDPANAGAIVNTIAAENTGSSGTVNCGSTGGGPDQSGAADRGGNLDGDGSCFSAAVSSDRTSVTSPLVAALGDNGGPTPTDALQPGSPAIGIGILTSCPATDQRGTAHQPTYCDSGAYQSIPAPVAPPAPAPAPVIKHPPVNTALPTISGELLTGSTLTATNGRWTGSPTSYVVNWYLCSTEDLDTCVDSYSVATGATYKPRAADQSNYVFADVTATNADGSTSALSNPVGPVVVPLNITAGATSTTSDTASLPIDCSYLNAVVCVLLLTFTAPEPNAPTTTKMAHAKTHLVVLGTERVTIARGKKKIVTIKLDRAGQKLLAAKKRLTVTLTIAQGKHTLKTRTVTFRVTKTKQQHH